MSITPAPRGAIFSQEAYAHAKMLDHSNLRRILRRNITPSDIDVVIDPASGEIGNPTALDAAGKIIYVELTRGAPEWHLVKCGQRLLYQNLIRATEHVAVLAHHNITPETGRQIDTLKDIASFQLMVWHNGPVCSLVFVGQPQWQRFLTDWVNNNDGPRLWRDHILGRGDWKPFQ